jgi:hypothetical protein
VTSRASTGPTARVRAVRASLKKWGLLPIVDSRLPSVTTIVAGEPIRGSWWGHPAGHEIYETLRELEQSPDVAFVRLLNGKVTLLHRRLWPTFFALVSRQRAWQMNGLDETAKALHAFVERSGEIRVDRLPAGFPGSPGSWRITARKLESRLLIDTDNIHTESGRHVLLLRSWKKRMSQLGIRNTRIEENTAMQRLGEATARLSAASGAAARLPWALSVRSEKRSPSTGRSGRH